jgi:hypothetical protein
MDALIRRLENMKRVGSRNTMQALGEKFVEVAQERAPVDSPERSSPPKHPGALRDSIHVAYAAPRAVGIVAGGEEAPYAQSIEYGARDHPIIASRASKLAFFWRYKNPPKPGGVYFKGTRVSHPGNEPQPFFGPTIREFAGYGVGGFFRSAGTKTISMAQAIGAEVRTLWNTGA